MVGSGFLSDVLEERKKEGKRGTPLSKDCRKSSDVCVEENERQE